MDAEATFLEHLEFIERVIGFLAKRHGLPRQEAEDMGSWVKVKLIENDYAVIRKYRGESRLTTYLTTVIHNLFRDFRIQNWGRFRPSAKARRLGPAAVRLETLRVRDGLGLEETVAQLVADPEVTLSAEELRDLAAELPQRERRRFENAEGLDQLAADEDVGARLKDFERARIHERTEEVLEIALRDLASEDLLILKMHYHDGLKFSQIAAALRLHQRSLYTRRDQSLRRLRAAFEAQGLEWQEVRRILGWEQTELGSRLPWGA